MTVRAALRMGAAALEAAGVPDARHDAGALLAHVLDVERLALLLSGDDTLPEATIQRYQQLIDRRAAREPLQYIVGHQEFMGLTLAVKPGVLIPREDTAVVVEQAIARLPDGGAMLDVGTGSGAIAIAVKHKRPDASMAAVDIAPEAVALARKNAQACGVAIDIVQGDLFSPFAGRRFDVIVSNPPYIPASELPRLQSEVQREPILALDGGEDGLAFYRRLLSEAPQHLVPDGSVVLELGDGLSGHVKRLAQQDFCDLRVYDDLAGLPRALAARLKVSPTTTNGETETPCR